MGAGSPALHLGHLLLVGALALGELVLELLDRLARLLWGIRGSEHRPAGESGAGLAPVLGLRCRLQRRWKCSVCVERQHAAASGAGGRTDELVLLLGLEQRLLESHVVVDALRGAGAYQNVCHARQSMRAGARLGYWDRRPRVSIRICFA